jgi:hypothetical protein
VSALTRLHEKELVAQTRKDTVLSGLQGGLCGKHGRQKHNRGINSPNHGIEHAQWPEPDTKKIIVLHNVIHKGQGVGRKLADRISK